MEGNAKVKRMAWARKKSHMQEVHLSTKKQKKLFQRKLRNGKDKEVPSGNAYRKVSGFAKWKYVSQIKYYI